jgi:hypothetical protein
MSDYNFEYTDTKFTLKLLGLSFLAFVVLLIAMVVTVDFIGIVGGLLLTFGVPVLLFVLNKKKIKKLGMANISDSSSEFKLADSTEKIDFANIISYRVERYNGTSLVIKRKDGKDFKLRANTNFCNAEHFDTFCQELDKAIQHYKTSNNVELTRKKSMFEKTWMLPLLIVMTVGLIGGGIFAISQGKNIPSILYTSAAMVIPLWIGYASARKKK